MKDVNVLLPISIATILIGAMMPYAFSALTMKSVGSAAAEMVFLFLLIKNKTIFFCLLIIKN